MEAKEHWIFYLQLSKNLSEDFFFLDESLKKSKKSLIPVTLKSLLECARESRAIHVLIIVKSYSEYKYFHRKIKKLIGYMMMTQRIHLYIASSFDGVNDCFIMKENYYNFIKLPVELETFSQSVSHMVDTKESQLNHWPGGIRPRLSFAGGL